MCVTLRLSLCPNKIHLIPVHTQCARQCALKRRHSVPVKAPPQCALQCAHWFSCSSAPALRHTSAPPSAPALCRTSAPAFRKAKDKVQTGNIQTNMVKTIGAQTGRSFAPVRPSVRPAFRK